MGSDKANLDFDGVTMLNRVIQVIMDVTPDVTVVAKPGQTLQSLPSDIKVIWDRHPDRGPVEGIASGLEANGEYEIAFVTSCDVPLLKASYIEFLIDSLSGFDAATVRKDQFLNPLGASYRIAPAQKAIRDLISKGNWRATNLLESMRTRVIELSELAEIDPEAESLLNINTPTQFQDAIQRWRQRQS